MDGGAAVWPTHREDGHFRHEDRKNAPPTRVSRKRRRKAAHRHGYESVAKAESFYVSDIDGPLLDGEIDRARVWGRQLAASITKQRTQRDSAANGSHVGVGSSLGGGIAIAESATGDGDQDSSSHDVGAEQHDIDHPRVGGQQ